MVDSLVINTGPLIALAKADALDLAGQLPYRFLCPAEVRRELDAGTAAGHQAIEPDWLEVVGLEAPLSPVTRASLDAGEAAVIQLALERQLRLVVIDESKARVAARAAGLQVTGSLGLLGRARRLGLIGEIGPLIQRASEGGVHYHPDLVRRVLEAVGEEAEGS